jgi:RNA polymerase-binding transcription factor DksA
MADLATTQGKVHALEQLRLRREKNKDIKKVDNAKLYAGSNMYYYCKSCNKEIVLPESHTCAVPSLCDECKALKELGWLE